VVAGPVSTWTAAWPGVVRRPQVPPDRYARMGTTMSLDEDDLTPPVASIVPVTGRTAELDGAHLKADIMALTGELAGRRFALDRKVQIGRDPEVEIHVPGNDVSRRHASIWRTDAGEYVVEDLKSRNGTLVNGKPVEVHILEFGDKLQIGSRTLFVFTQHQALEEELVRWQRIELVAEMTAGLVHDFNNYMTALLGYVQYIEDFAPQTKTREELMALLNRCLPVMEDAAKEGSNVARKVLTFARGSKRPQAPLPVGPVVEKAVALVRRTFDESIIVEQEIEEGLRVTGDKTELLQVLINLFLNARDAMPEGGTLRIEACTKILDEVQARELNLPMTGEMAVIEVKDTGTGMEEETRKRIFEPLYTTKGKGKGTGLGLSMVSRIIENHGGQIRVESTPGAGTRFSIYLPVAVVTSDSYTTLNTTMVAAPARPAKSKGLVLMLNDEERMRLRAARVAYAMGYDVLTADSVDEVFALYERYNNKIELVIFSLDFKGAPSGDEVFDRLLRIDPDAGVLFTSEGADEGQFTARIRRVLQTPCDSRTLRDALSDALE
jgi:signal transduction histidine kinase